jgi:DNA end-binding protein Ku
MQTIWKGSISFGLVSIPVRLYSATEERSVSFRQVHAEDGGRIRYRRVCEKDGAEVAYRDIAKGYDLPDGDTIILTDEDFANLPLTSSRTVEVLQFVPFDQLDSVYVNRSYYMQPDGPGLKPYVLLREALQRAGKAAVVKVALRNKESLALLRPREDVLVMQTMLWPDEVRDTSSVAPDEDVTMRPQEIAMAESYIETLSGDLELGAYHDEYRAALEELVAAKAAGREVQVRGEERPEGGVVVDLMEALRQSVEAAQRGRGTRISGDSVAGSGRQAPRDADVESESESASESESESRPAKASGTRRGSTKKAASNKTSGKKAAAKKTAEKKAPAAKSATSKRTAPRTASAKKAGSAKTTSGRKTAASKGASNRSAAAKETSNGRRTARKSA